MHQTNRFQSSIRIALVLSTLLTANPAQSNDPNDVAALQRVAGGLVIHRFMDADRAFANRRDDREAFHALRLYQELYEQDPRDVQAAWRLAMAHTFIARRLTEDKKDKKKHYAKGRDVGQRAIDIDPKCAPCHFWTAVNMTFYGRRVGMFKILFTLVPLQD